MPSGRDSDGDNVWHISTINGDPIEVADTLRGAKAMVDRMLVETGVKR